MVLLQTADYSEKHSLSAPDKFNLCYVIISEPIPDKQTDRPPNIKCYFLPNVLEFFELINN